MSALLLVRVVLSRVGCFFVNFALRVIRLFSSFASSADLSSLNTLCNNRDLPKTPTNVTLNYEFPMDKASTIEVEQSTPISAGALAKLTPAEFTFEAGKQYSRNKLPSSYHLSHPHIFNDKEHFLYGWLCALRPRLDFIACYVSLVVIH